ncbi:hypothetical protein WJX81_003408 [Elliptochloris bilobata]|uniref:GTP diphosphokinase n=1 Tax=Elliptochloris bilobata TaxID=381761 RepID=A0AAW1RXJ3_9CHLO
MVRRTTSSAVTSLVYGNAIASVAHGPIQPHGPNTLMWYSLAGMLSASVGAWVVTFAKFAWEHLEHVLLPSSLQPLQEERWLYGVDVTGSRFLSRPEVLRAAHFAAEAHAGQVRLTGDPYVVHLVETACIVECLLEITLKEADERVEAAVTAALLHDVVDDTPVTLEAVAEHFGERIAGIVAQVSQLSNTNQLLRRQRRKNSEVFGNALPAPGTEDDDRLRTMILTMVHEPLVIVVKLADRLHNMRTVYALRPDRQRAVATETLQVWCSLAERLGMFALKSELEDLCFAVLQPAKYRALRRGLDELWGLSSLPEEARARELVASVLPFDAVTFRSRGRAGQGRPKLHVLEGCAAALLRELQLEAQATGLDVHIEGRLKSLYSVHRKMARKRISLAEVFDARALRVVVSDAGGQGQAAVEACYQIMPTVQRLWKPIFGEFDDYIVHPKPSGYQSLHTAVIGPDRVPVEVQIRTSSMHEVAEYGQAAHWAYKDAPAAPPQPPPKPDLSVGKAVMRVAGGKLQLGVVVDTSEPNRITVVVRCGSQFAPNTIVPVHKCRELVAYVHQKRWWAPGHGNLRYVLEAYEPARDGKWHLVDVYNQRLPPYVQPLRQAAPESDAPATSVATAGAAAATGVASAAGAAAAAAGAAGLLQTGDAAAAGAGGAATGTAAAAAAGMVAGQPDGSNAGERAHMTAEQDLVTSKIQLLRRLLEWGREVEAGASAGDAADVLVMIWPPGRIARRRRGTTAGDVIRAEGRIEIEEPGRPRPRADTRLVNVNNRLVPASTPLADGDFVVLSPGLLHI